LADYLARARKARKMTSEKQKAANRDNARHSTGPKTSEGKAAVRLNALRHGLLTRDVVLPEEDADAFEDLWNRVRANLSPVGPIEEFLVDRVINAMWRLRRLERAETALLHSRIHELKAGRLAKEVNSYVYVVDFSLPSPTKPRIRKRTRRLRALNTSGTETRSSSDGQSTQTPKRETPSPS
jgi:hypothetical protein